MMRAMFDSLAKSDMNFQQIQNLNSEEPLGLEQADQQERVIDPDYDPNLIIVEKGAIDSKQITDPLINEVITKIGELDIRLAMCYSSVLGTKAIKVKAWDNNGHVFQGWLAAAKENDKQGIFSNEAWETIKENRNQLVKMMRSMTGGPTDTDSDPISEGGESSSSVGMSIETTEKIQVQLRGNLSTTLAVSYTSQGIRTVALVAQDDNGHVFKGELRAVRANDRPGTFTHEAWGTVQENRDLIMEMATSMMTGTYGQRNDLKLTWAKTRLETDEISHEMSL
jgi:hypothetical protein